MVGVSPRNSCRLSARDVLNVCAPYSVLTGYNPSSCKSTVRGLSVLFDLAVDCDVRGLSVPFGLPVCCDIRGLSVPFGLAVFCDVSGISVPFGLVVFCDVSGLSVLFGLAVSCDRFATLGLTVFGVRSNITHSRTTVVSSSLV